MMSAAQCFPEEMVYRRVCMINHSHHVLVVFLRRKYHKARARHDSPSQPAQLDLSYLILAVLLGPYHSKVVIQSKQASYRRVDFIRVAIATRAGR